MKSLRREVWAIAAAKVAVLLGTTRLGYHRDELYFVAASKRLSPSYVDFQPVIPLLVRAERAVFGDLLLGLRLIPALAGAATVLLAALIARELGGSRRAQLLAAFALAVVPLFLGMSGTLNTVGLETPAWMLVTFVLARMARTNDARLWPWLGAAIALGLLVKFTELAYLAGMGAAVIVSPLRRHLRAIWPWVGAAIALAAIAPSVVWQASHHWAVVEFVSHQGTGGAVLGLRGRPGFLVGLAILPGPVALWLWVPGLRRLWRDATFRVLGLTNVIALLVLLAASGKGYYAAPGLAVFLAAGAVAVDARPSWSPRPLIVAMVVNVLLTLPLLLPLVPVSELRASPQFAEATELGERIGWEDLAVAVARVDRALPAGERSRAVVIGSNYALPAAVEFYARRYHLPPAGSGHNSAYLWRPRVRPDHVAIMIGFDERTVAMLYRDVQRVGAFRNREGVHNYEWGDPIYVAQGPKLSWDEEWRRLKEFSA